MSKRGLLLAEETLKIVIAVISLGVLIFFLASIYFNSQSSREKELAQATLENVIEDLNQEKESTILLNPLDWQLLSWPLGELKPSSCIDKNWEHCLCICKPLSVFTPNMAVEGCSESGVCAELSKRTIVQGAFGQQSPITIDDVPLTVSFEYVNGEVIVTEK